MTMHDCVPTQWTMDHRLLIKENGPRITNVGYLNVEAKHLIFRAQIENKNYYLQKALFGIFITARQSYTTLRTTLCFVFSLV